MAIIYENMLVDGVGYASGIFQVHEGEPYLGKFFVSDGNQGLEVKQMVVCTGKPQYYIFARVDLDKSATWRVWGRSTLINREICISYTLASAETLLQSQVAKTTADANGDFYFNPMEFTESSIYIWCTAPFTYDDLRAHYIAVEKEAIIAKDSVLRYIFFNTWNKDTCPACGGTTKIVYDSNYPLKSYNGIELPELPSDANNYTNVCISGDVTNPRLWMTNYTIAYNDNSNNGTVGYGFLDGNNVPQSIAFYQKDGDKWSQTTSTNQGFSSLIWTRNPIYLTDGTTIKDDASPAPGDAAVCEVCDGTGYEQIYNGTTFTCRTCNGDGGVAVGACPAPGCSTHDGKMYPYFQYARCYLEGTGPDPAFNDGNNYYISYWPDTDDYPEEIVAGDDTLLKLNNNVAYTYNATSSSFNFYIDDHTLTAFKEEYNAEADRESPTRWVLWTSGTDESASQFTLSTVMREGGQATGNGNPCLPGETMIATPNGEVRLDSLKPGDQVLSSIGPTIVSHNWGPEPVSSYIKYYFENNIVIKETAPHPFYNVDRNVYLRLPKWEIGEHALDINGNKVKLLSKEICPEPSEKYSLFTAAGDYYANGLLNGSIICNKKLLAKASGKNVVQIIKSLDQDAILQQLDLKRGFLP